MGSLFMNHSGPERSPVSVEPLIVEGNGTITTHSMWPLSEELSSLPGAGRTLSFTSASPPPPGPHRVWVVTSLARRLAAPRRGSAVRLGSAPRLARIIFLAMMVGFTSACQCNPNYADSSYFVSSCPSNPGCTWEIVLVQSSGCGIFCGIQYQTTNRSDGPERLGCLFPTGIRVCAVHYLRRGTPAVPRGRRTVN